MTVCPCTCVRCVYTGTDKVDKQTGGAHARKASNSVADRHTESGTDNEKGHGGHEKGHGSRASSATTVDSTLSKRSHRGSSDSGKNSPATAQGLKQVLAQDEAVRYVTHDKGAFLSRVLDTLLNSANTTKALFAHNPDLKIKLASLHSKYGAGSKPANTSSTGGGKHAVNDSRVGNPTPTPTAPLSSSKGEKRTIKMYPRSQGLLRYFAEGQAQWKINVPLSIKIKTFLEKLRVMFQRGKKAEVDPKRHGLDNVRIYPVGERYDNLDQFRLGWGPEEGLQLLHVFLQLGSPDEFELEYDWPIANSSLVNVPPPCAHHVLI